MLGGEIWTINPNNSSAFWDGNKAHFTLEPPSSDLFRTSTEFSPKSFTGWCFFYVVKFRKFTKNKFQKVKNNNEHL
jgi:hypothetical protein